MLNFEVGPWEDIIPCSKFLVPCSLLFQIKSPRFSTKAFLKRCRGRDRTFTRQLAVVQSSVVDPGRINIATETALCYVYPVILTPETRGHVCQKFHHPTICSDLYRIV
jgi:hypothetical protein